MTVAAPRSRLEGYRMRVRARLIRSRLLTLTYKMGWTHRLKIYSIQHVKVQYSELSQDSNLGPRSKDKTLTII